jgi:hypothetical protein
MMSTDVLWLLDYQKQVFEMCLAEFNKETTSNDERKVLDSSLDLNLSVAVTEGVI